MGLGGMLFMSTVYAATLSGLFLIYHYFYRGKKAAGAGPHPRLRLRSSSIGSTRLMCSGTLPGLTPAQWDPIINICVWFHDKAEVRPDEIKRLFKRHIIPHMRFHCYPVQQKPCGPITWVPKAIDMARHFTEHTPVPCQPVADGYESYEANLRRQVDELINITEMPVRLEQRPLWEVHFLQASPDSSRPDTPVPMVMVIRVTHTIGDGVSLMEVFSEVLTDARGERVDFASIASPGAASPTKGTSTSFESRISEPRAGRGSLPLQLLSAILYATKFAWALLSAFAVSAVGSDTPGPLNDPIRKYPWRPGIRRVLYLPRQPLAIVKHIKDSLNTKNALTGTSRVTINDVQYALLAGALGRLLEMHGGDARRAQMRSMTAVGVPEPACKETRLATLLRNNWTFVVGKMPIYVGPDNKSAEARIMAANAVWRAVKQGPTVEAAFTLHRLGSLMPASLQKNTVYEMGCRCTLVFSNMPGPATECFVARARVSAIYMVHPNLAQQVGLMSIGDYIHGCITVAAAVPHQILQQQLAECFCNEWDAAVAEVLGEKSPLQLPMS